MKWLILTSVLLLAACANTVEPTTRPIVIDSKPIERPNLTLPPIDEFRSENVEWIIVTPENIEEVFAEMQRRGEPVVIFGTTEDGYEALAVNNQQALRVILQQQAVIRGYEEYYIRTDRNIANHNARQ